MTIDEIIQSRRSVYPAQFSGEKVPHELIRRMLNNALWAPTHYKTQPWQFVVFEGTSKNRLLDHLAYMYSNLTPPEQFSEAKYQKFEQRKEQVSHLIAINMRRHERDGLPEEEEIAAVAMAVQNMWLTLAAEPRCGGYWSSGNLIYQAEFAEFMKLNKNERCLGLFYVGCIDEKATLPKRERDAAELHIRWES